MLTTTTKFPVRNPAHIDPNKTVCLFAVFSFFVFLRFIHSNQTVNVHKLKVSLFQKTLSELWGSCFVCVISILSLCCTVVEWLHRPGQAWESVAFREGGFSFVCSRGDDTDNGLDFACVSKTDSVALSCLFCFVVLMSLGSAVGWRTVRAEVTSERTRAPIEQI